jgi:CubicO group peptidase (beta-lactamase class C family)
MTQCDTKGQENNPDAFITSLCKTNKTAGLAIAVEKDNRLVFNKNFGYADVENKIAVTDSTQFNIMSISKIFIACSIMQLADKKIIDLDAPVTKYLEKLPAPYNQVLIYQLLNHSAGVPDYIHVNGYMAQANRNQTPEEVLAPVIDKPLDFRPGEKSAYSNSGYFLLGLLIEKITGIGLDKYLKKNIFQPLGMNHTYLDSSVTGSKSRTKGYICSNNQLEEEIHLDPSQYWAAGGIISTKEDMLKWNEAIREGTILPLNEIRQMMQPSKLKDGSMSDYGLGFELMNTPSMKLVGNNGVGIGFNTSNLQFVNDGLTILVLSNTTNSNSTLIAKNIRDIIMNNKNDEPQPNKDKLDTLVEHLITDAQKEIINPLLFEDSVALSKFKNDAFNFIKSQGDLLNIDKQGEKINPQSIVRRYQVNFQKGKTTWVFIFSNEGKIIIANHM